jgi:hypothetical protein
LIRGQGTKGLCTKRASKKRKPAKSFPLWRVFLF